MEWKLRKTFRTAALMWTVGLTLHIGSDFALASGHMTHGVEVIFKFIAYLMLAATVNREVFESIVTMPATLKILLGSIALIVSTFIVTTPTYRFMLFVAGMLLILLQLFIMRVQTMTIPPDVNPDETAKLKNDEKAKN